MPERVWSREEILNQLGQGLPRNVATTAGATMAQLHTAPAHDEWSANSLLAHLRACADVWGDAIRLLAREDNPTFRAVNPRTWLRKTEYLDLEFPVSLAAFAAQRNDLLAFLEALPAEAWQRSGTATGAGRPLIRTVYSYAQDMAIHERPHLKQIERTMADVRGELRQ